ncbi:hypothetical protein EB796_002336 [Bugula neritina]|uniref:Uncharacterized protein n=1 Tax=Bugula neritina TaxID=10212 RepID=A0A7J7KMI4_BUGNE|nr:hypothetical protein EB796_002336 [Bugula neritina]
MVLLQMGHLARTAEFQFCTSEKDFEKAIKDADIYSVECPNNVCHDEDTISRHLGEQVPQQHGKSETNLRSKLNIK